MLEILSLCSSAEAEAQAFFLSATPVAGLADLIRSGQLRVFHGLVTSVETLANIRTEFGAIGPISPKNDKFLVRELVPVLRANPHVPDDRLLARIEELRQPLRQGTVPMNITILCWEGAYFIKDGNKRSVATYENMIEAGLSDIKLPVYVLVPRSDA